MTAMQADKLVDDYLRRLEQAAAHLQRSRRAELVAEIREHIEAALRQEEEVDEATVRNVLERLGHPDEIVDAAEPPVSPPAVVAGRRTGVLEIAALVALLVPFLGWLVGIVLVTVSRAWSSREKLVGVGLLALIVLLPAFTLWSERGGEDAVPIGDDRPLGVQDEGTSFLAGPEVLFIFLAGLPSALYLGWRLSRKRGPA